MRERSEATAYHSLLAEQLVPLRTVCIVTGLSRSTVYRMVAGGAFPRPVKISQTRVAWREREVRAWLSSLDWMTPPAVHRELRHAR